VGEYVRLEVEAGIGTIRIDRPKMNALDAQVQRELIEAAREADSRPDVAAVILYGGERVFAAGADVKEMADMTFEVMDAHSHLLQDFTKALAGIGKPTVAAITGFALGGGLEVALTADLRFAADDAKLGQPEILLGIIPGAGGTQRLARLVGPSKAKDLIYTGRFIGAEEALALGLVDEVLPADQVYARARDWASQFVGGPALALRAAKVAVDDGIDADLVDGLETERREFAGLFKTADQKVGMRSFVENGPGKATFEGR
jgi:enoyl-CoA hydratase/carnithine racemase